MSRLERYYGRDYGYLLHVGARHWKLKVGKNIYNEYALDEIFGWEIFCENIYRIKYLRLCGAEDSVYVSLMDEKSLYHMCLAVTGLIYVCATKTP